MQGSSNVNYSGLGHLLCNSKMSWTCMLLCVLGVLCVKTLMQTSTHSGYVFVFYCAVYFVCVLECT